MKLNFLLVLNFSLLIVSSCTQGEKSQDECEDLSLASFRGNPTAAASFQESCQSYPLHYTKDLCQKALVDLIYTANKEFLEKKYGAKVMGCFTQNDLDKFIKR